MKKIFLSLFILITVATLNAQNVNSDIELTRDLAAAERKLIVSENMMLTDEESKIFWPIFDQYRADAREIGTEKIAYMKDFADSYENMTDEKAAEIMSKYFSLEADYLALRSSYKDKMTAVLSDQLVFRFFQIDNKIDALINLGLASEVPLIIKK